MSKLLGYMAIDQHGHSHRLNDVEKSPRTQLLNKLGRKHCEKMYQDFMVDPKVRHVGYIIAGLWLTVHEVRAWEGKVTI